MSFPDPHPGLVIRYAYLRKRVPVAGREEGSEDRPCSIVVSVLDDEGEQEVMVLPIRHSAPQRVEDAIEIPAATLQRLGPDSEHSWIMIDEANEFVWPGPDLRPVPGRDDSTIMHGALPPKFFAHVRDRFIERVQRDKSRVARRTD